MGRLGLGGTLGSNTGKELLISTNKLQTKTNKLQSKYMCIKVYRILS